MRLSSSRSTAILHRPQQDFLLWDKAGTRPSLDQQFADRRDLIDAISGQQLITHTRASAGTYVGSDGLIKTAVTNLVLQSEDFSTTWSTTRASVSANSIAAPNGTLTADTLTADGTTLQHNVAQSASFSATGDKTYSVFAKAGTNNFMQMLVGGNVNVYANFDLSTGTIGDVGTQSTADIASLGDGWYRCQLTTSQTNPTSVVIGLVAASNSIRAESNSLSTSIYLWGAQLEASSTVGEYIPTTSTINSAPRFDHDPVTGESLGLLIEEQRSNLLLNSGTLATQDVTVTAVAHTLSFYGSGTVTLSGTHTATVVGTGAYPARTTLTFTPTAGTLTVTVSGTVEYANLEIGSFATSYIPTTSSTVTRAADVVSITGANFSSWYRQDEGTMFAQASSQSTSAKNAIIAQSDSNGSSEIFSLFHQTDEQAVVRLRLSNSDVFAYGFGTIVDGTAYKAVGAYRTLNSAASLNGANAVSSTASFSNPTTFSVFRIGTNQLSGEHINGTIRRLVYWDQRLPNDTLEAITQ